MADWKNTKCGSCVIQRSAALCNTCMDYCYHVPMSNADRIRVMNNQEMAVFLKPFLPGFLTVDDLENWLEEEVEG